MDQYFIYIIISSITISIPGPGVIFTLTNALKYKLFSILPGIFGIATGMLIISAIAATSIGMIIKASPIIYLILKIAGAIYLVYIGIKLFMSSSIKTLSKVDKKTIEEKPNIMSQYKQGVAISLVNPKPILFFIALFPQFIHYNQPFILQFLKLSITFCILVCIIHFVYATLINIIKTRFFSTNSGFQIVNRIGGSFFIFFALVLLISCIDPHIW